MGLQYNVYLSSNHRIYGCKACKTHLSTHEDILSRVSDPRIIPCTFHKALSSTSPTYCSAILIRICFQNFRGQHGKAFLFENVVNITQGEPSERSMTTGKHIVRDIYCRQCNNTVGWKYDKAFEQTEKYKEGKFILESELLVQVQ